MHVDSIARRCHLNILSAIKSFMRIRLSRIRRHGPNNFCPLGLPVAPALAAHCPGNPGAIGTSRTIVVDPAEHRKIGTMNYAETLPLVDKEVVLTFDDGPLPPYTDRILDILAAECVKATYFIVGSMARANPELVRRVYDARPHRRHAQHEPPAPLPASWDWRRPRRRSTAALPRRLRRWAMTRRLRRSSAFPASATAGAGRGLCRLARADGVGRGRPRRRLAPGRRARGRKACGAAAGRQRQRHFTSARHPSAHRRRAATILLAELKARGFRIVHVQHAERRHGQPR